MRIWGKRAARTGPHFRAKVAGSTVAISVAVLAALPMLASATSSIIYPPYYSPVATANGYDVSWPNCSATPPGSSVVSFAIVGIGGGRPFTSNSCAAPEYLKASDLGMPSLYYNTGYVGAYGRDIVSACTGAVGTAADPSGLDTFGSLKGHALSQAERAWEIGCSEAEYGFKIAKAANEPAAYWWADVETGNSWSTSTSLNQFAIDGMSYAMNVMNTTSSGVVVGGGIYSSPGSWTKLTGRLTFAPTPAAATWVASGTCTSSPSSSLAGISPAVVQNSSYDINGSGTVDADEAC